MNEHKIRDPGRAGPADVIAGAELAVGAFFETRRARRATLAVIAVTGVNIVAFLGQLAYWQDHVATLAEQVLIAAVLESIAIYWASQAHRARMANDSAFRPALASYLFAAGVGALNYSHYMLPGWRPTVLAVTFGGMSAISPWLWASYSRRVNRDELKARGDIEDHAVRLGATRWAWHAYRCIRVMWVATWEGVTRPAEAIARYEERRASRRAARAEPAVQAAAGRAKHPGRVLVPAQAPALARLTEAEQALVLKLSGRAGDLPTARELGRTEKITRPSAGKVLAAVRAASNGGSHGRA